MRSPVRSPIRSAGYTFVNAEAAALVARFTTPPTDARKALIDNFIGATKATGAFQRWDGCGFLAAADSQAARRNWVQDQYNPSAVSGPTFVADKGYTGDGSTSYLDTGFNPTTAASPKFTQDDAAMGIFILTNVSETRGDMGSLNSSILASYAAVGNAMGSRGNTSVTVDTAISPYTSIGLTSWSRSASGSYQPYKNGVALTPAGTTSAAPANANFRVGATSSFSTKQVAFYFYGASLTAQQMADVYAAATTYLQAVGAI